MSPTLARGVLVSHYEILSRIGAGGMGEVYEAHDRSLERSVALKILPPAVVENADRVRRFVQEAKSASGLSHPHIVTIYEIGESVATSPPETSASGAPAATRSGPIHFIAMELIQGQTLKQKIHDQKAELKALLVWLAQVAEALSKAHAAGIVHRDLKPENIMVTRDGYAKVLDFGLAKLTETMPDGATALRGHTAPGAVVGTAGYMAPEQVQGLTVDHRADIFSFGCVLYEATTRQKPFAGASTVDVMHQILHDSPVPVNDLNPHAPSELRRMIRRCLAKDPEQRYQSMKDLAIELADLTEEFDVLAGSSSARSTSSSSGDRLSAIPRWPSPGLRLGIAGAILVLAGLVAVLLLRERTTGATSGGSSPQTKFTQLTEASGLETQPTLSPDGNYLAYASDARGNWDIYLLRLGGQNAINLTERSTENDYQPSFSPDGQKIAFRSMRDGGGVFVMGATGESVRRLTTAGFDPSWSPDGKKIVVASEGPVNPFGRSSTSSLSVIDAVSGNATVIHKGDAVQPRWSPDGRRIAFWGFAIDGSGQRDIATIPATGGDPVWLTQDAAIDWNPVWAGDGRSLVFSSNRGGSMNLWRIGVDPDSGQALGAPEPITTPARFSGWISVAAGKIAYTAVDTRSNVIRVPFDLAQMRISGPATPLTSGSGSIRNASLSPDQQWLVYTAAGNQEDLILSRADGSEVRKLTDDPPKDRGASWTPDSQRVVFYSDRGSRYEVWSVRTDGSDLRQITRTTGRSHWFPSISPDGQLLEAGNEEGTVIFDLTGDLPVSKSERLPKIAEDSIFLATSWSPDSSRLAGWKIRSLDFESLGIAIYSFATKSYSFFPLSAGGVATPLQWTSDGLNLICGSRKKLWAFDVARQQIREISGIPAIDFTQAVPAPDGKSIVTIDESNESDIWLATMQ